MSGNFTAVECCRCATVFGVTESFQRNRWQDKEYFYCPNGHSQRYTESEADRLRRQVDRLTQEQARLLEEAAARERSHSTTVRKLTRAAKAAVVRRERTNKAIDAGKCPGCGEHFPDLLRHRQQKHGLACAA